MMEQLTPVRSLFEDTKSFDGKTVKVGGWVRNLRMRQDQRPAGQLDQGVGQYSGAAQRR